MLHNNLIRGMFVLTILVFVVGCSNKYDLHKIVGTVTLDGQPVSDVSVTFVAQEDGGRDCGGYTDADGVFTMTSAVGKGGDGTSPGKYKVCFEKNVSRSELPEGDPRRVMGPGDIEVVNVLPDKYQVADTTEFEIEVAKGRNSFNFDLTSK